VAQEAKERAEAEERKQQLKRKTLEIQEGRRHLEAQIAKMRSDFEIQGQRWLSEARQMELREKQINFNRLEMSHARKADRAHTKGNG
jgi:hypothetical protein